MMIIFPLINTKTAAVSIKESNRYMSLTFWLHVSAPAVLFASAQSCSTNTMTHSSELKQSNASLSLFQTYDENKIAKHPLINGRTRACGHRRYISVTTVKVLSQMFKTNHKLWLMC